MDSGRAATPNLANHSLTLQQVLQVAKRRNPGLQAARSRWQAARDRAPAVSGLPDPHIRLNVMAEESVTRNGPVEAQYRISQKIPWFGKLDAKEKAALAVAGAASARYRRERLTLSAKVAETFYDLYYAQRAIEITQGIIELVERLEASIRAKYVSGQVNQQDLLKIQIEREELQNKLDDQRDVEQATRARLNGLLHRPG